MIPNNLEILTFCSRFDTGVNISDIMTKRQRNFEYFEYRGVKALSKTISILFVQTKTLDELKCKIQKILY